MAAKHASTPPERMGCVVQLLAHRGEYGVVSAAGRDLGVSRQTLSTWRAAGQRALEAAFAPVAPPPAGAPPELAPELARAILTALIDGQASERGVRAELARWGRRVSVRTIVAVVGEAGRRAQALLEQPVAVGPRVVALDEIYGKDRHGAYLSLVDAQAGAVWATAGPVAVDGDSWTLLVWQAQARGLDLAGTVSDGGQAIRHGAAAIGAPEQLDVWHTLHRCGQARARLEGRERALQARVAARAPLRGRPPAAPLAARLAAVERAHYVTTALHYLTGELHRLLDVVVVMAGRLLAPAERQAEAAALLALLADLAADAPTDAQPELQRLHRHLVTALPRLLAFTQPLGAVQARVAPLLAPDAMALIAWAWQRRAILGPTTEDSPAGLPPAWCPAARLLLAAWDRAVRASSLVESWHSFLRPHLAVHRALRPGLLALLAVAYNHHASQRGVHRGTTPLQRAGLADAPTDWLTALGYPPASGAPAVASAGRQSLPQAA